ncbi:MAG: ElyC/SanA/YdcF family protein [Vicinamibacterales bacterium]
MTDIPRSRYEFVLRLYDEQRRESAAGDPRATLTNVRWTGTLPYAAVEGYERMLTAMRRYRAAGPGENRDLIEREIAFYMGWTGHYTGDGAQPLHDTVHHDGWQGPNPKGYTTEPRVHGRFESQFVDLMELKAADFQSTVPEARLLPDPFTAILAHLDRAAEGVERVYELDKAGALADASNASARALVIERVASGAALLRDLAYTAWIRSGEPPVADPAGNTIVPAHPAYDPTTGSAPAFRPDAVRPAGDRPAGEAGEGPLVFADPVMGKSFYLFEAIAATPAVHDAVAMAPALRAARDVRLAAMDKAVATCETDIGCHAAAFRWPADEVASIRTAFEALAPAPAGRALAARLRASGLFVRYQDRDDAALLGQAWADAAAGLNRIISVYALGQPPFYPAIDAVSHDVASETYQREVRVITDVLHDRRSDLACFFDPTRQFAHALLLANRRDEAGRHEPMHLGVNAPAYGRIPGIDWSKYRYPVILVPGAGTDSVDVRLSVLGRLRVEAAAARYRAGQAPLIVVSGGYVHPAQTPWAEAIEMKRALVEEYGVPESAVLVDPHARHTTTNLRNTARLMFRYGIPTDRPSLVTTDRYQSGYIEGEVFRARNLKEVGYEPAAIGKRISVFDLEFVPSRLSLQADARIR